MRRVIGGLNPFQFDEISNTLGDWYYDVSAQEYTGLYDVVLDDSTILNAYDDKIRLNLNGRKYELGNQSFCFIVIE